jgi:hypothetical protein
MTVYLAHRLRRAGVGAPRQVWVVESQRPWFFEDLSDELAVLFPGAEVRLSPTPDGECDLAVIPFMHDECDLAWRRRALRSAARSKPTFLGLYELGRRRLVVVPRRRLSRYLLRLTAEQWLRFSAWFVGAVSRRARRVLARRETER